MKHKIIASVRQVIEQVRDRLPPDNVSDAEDLLDHNEWGEALRLICTQLYEYDVVISEELYQTIEQAGTAMKLDPGELKYLEELVR